MSNPTVVCWGELVWDLLPTGPASAARSPASRTTSPNWARDRSWSRASGATSTAARRSVRSRRPASTRFVQVDPARPTGSVRVTVVDGEHYIAAEAAWDDDLRRRAGTRARGSRRRGVRHARAAHRPCVGGALSRALLRRAGIRVCDLNLRAPSTRPRPSTPRSPRDGGPASTRPRRRSWRARRRHDPVASLASEGLLVALTRGARGALLAQGGARAPRRARGPGGDAVECGDAFTAVLTCGLLDETPLPDLVARACAYASFVAARTRARCRRCRRGRRAPALRQIDAP